MPNPQIPVGLLNRVITQLVVPSFPALNVTASYMAKAQVKVTYEGPFTDQEPTAVDIVNSPKPFVMATVEVSVLRSQPNAGTWIAQAQASSVFGDVITYSDSTVYPALTFGNCSLVDYDPGAFDGMDPAVKVTLKGRLFINNDLWG
jgi:hypothetical protein